MRTHKRGVLGGVRGRGAAKPSKGSGHLTQERVSRGTGVWGARGSVPQTCTRELGGLGGSSPAPWPRRLRHMAYLTPPPSSQQRRRRRERERLVPETVQQGGRSHSHAEASGHLETLTDQRWGGHSQPHPTRGSRSPKLTPAATLPSGGLGGQIVKIPRGGFEGWGAQGQSWRSP